MDLEQLKDLYYSFGGSKEDEWHTFFEDTPEEQSILVPGCSFRIEKEGDIYRGIVTLPDGQNTVVQDDTAEPLPGKMQLAAIKKLLCSDGAAEFVCRLLLGRMIAVEDECSLEMDDDGISFSHCNITARLDNKALTVKQDGAEYCSVEVSDTEAALEEMAETLLEISSPAMSFIGQDELLENNKEHYPEFVPYIKKSINLAYDNAASYHIKVPAASDAERILWIIIEQYSATVGMDGNSLCDDIGLHIDAVSKYVDAICDERTLLVTKYKDEEHLDRGDYYEIMWRDAPKDAQELENEYAKKNKCLSKIVNKGRIIDIFSWKGTYSMTLKL